MDKGFSHVSHSNFFRNSVLNTMAPVLLALIQDQTSGSAERYSGFDSALWITFRLSSTKNASSFGTPLFVVRMMVAVAFEFKCWSNNSDIFLICKIVSAFNIIIFSSNTSEFRIALIRSQPVSSYNSELKITNQSCGLSS